MSEKWTLQEMVNINTIKEAIALATDLHIDESNGKVSILLLTAQKYSIWLNVSFLLMILTPLASMTPHSSTYSSSVSFSGSSSSYQLNVKEPWGLNSDSVFLRRNKNIAGKRMDLEAKLSSFESYLLLINSVWNWVIYLVYRCLRFFICKIGIIIAPTIQFCCRD